MLSNCVAFSQNCLVTLNWHLFVLSNFLFLFLKPCFVQDYNFLLYFSQNILIVIFFSIIRLWSFYFSVKLVFCLRILQSAFLKHFTLIKRYAGIFWMTVHQHYKAVVNCPSFWFWQSSKKLRSNSLNSLCSFSFCF